MTTRDVLRSLRTAWPILVVGLLVTVLACHHVSKPEGTYWSRTSVFVLAPSNVDNANNIAFTSDSVIATAGLVAHMVAPSTPGSASTSSDTSLVAEGVTSGSRIRLPDSGGQWTNSFTQPLLDVEVVGDDPTAVGAEATRLVDEISQTLEHLQAADGVSPKNRMTTVRAPDDVQVHMATGDAQRAIAVTFLLGSALSFALAVGSTPWLSDRGRRLRDVVARARYRRRSLRAIAFLPVTRNETP